MVQDQLTDYISSQMKLGVSRDAIRSALIAAGWAAGDVEDTLKKAENVNSPTARAMKPSPPMGDGAPSGGAAIMGGANAVPKAADPQSIRVSDLVSATDVMSAAGSFGKSISKNERAKPAAAGRAATEVNPGLLEKKQGGSIMMIAGIMIILGLTGLAGFLYFQNSGLAAKVAALSSKSADVASRVASFKSEVQALNATTTALAAKVASLTEENRELQANLSFMGKTLTGSSATSSETVSISGTLTAGKSPYYTLTTRYNVIVSVANSKDVRVDAALKPLVNSTSSVKLTGTHVPGSGFITVTAVNGAALTQPTQPTQPTR